MAKKKATKKKTGKKVKKTKVKGIEPHEWFYWAIATGMFAVFTGLAYGLVNHYVVSPMMLFDVIPFETKNAILVFVMAFWVVISTVYIFPKFKKD